MLGLSKPRRFLVILISFFVIVACDRFLSKEQQLVRLKSERRDLLDQLFKDYGGSPFAESARSTIRSSSPATPGNDASGVRNAAGNLVTDFDRGIFERNIATLGRGEHPMVLTERARNFLDQSSVRRKAQRIYEIELAIESLEKQIKSQP